MKANLFYNIQHFIFYVTKRVNLMVQNVTES